MFKLDLEKWEDQRSNCQHLLDHRKPKELQKSIYFCFTDYAKAFYCMFHKILWKILKEMGVPDHLTCLLRNLYADQESNRYNQIWNELVQNWKRSMSRPYIVTCLFNLCAEYILRNTKLDETQAGIKAARRNINNLRYANDTTLMAESQEELKSLLMKVKEESENVGLKPNIQKMKIRPSGPITSWQVDGWKNGNSDKFYFLGLQNHWRQWLQPRN